MAVADVVLTPFGESVEEIPLTTPPLIVALAQVRFPVIASIAREEYVGPFQECIRDEYPFLMKELQTVGVTLSERGVETQTNETPVWRFLDHDRRPTWKVSLAPSFVALETVDYPSHAEFLRRLRTVLDALSHAIGPPACTRIGLRYVDRLEAGPDLAELVRPEVLGLASTPHGDDAQFVHELTDAQFEYQNAVLHGRWGQLPAGAVLDHIYGNALAGPSWVLDLDMYSDSIQGGFDAEQLVGLAERFATDIYRFFRWAVRPELLRRCGGDL